MSEQEEEKTDVEEKEDPQDNSDDTEPNARLQRAVSRLKKETGINAKVLDARLKNKTLEEQYDALELLIELNDNKKSTRPRNEPIVGTKSGEPKRNPYLKITNKGMAGVIPAAKLFTTKPEW